MNTAIRLALEALKGKFSLNQVNNLAQRIRQNYDQNASETNRVYTAINLLLLRGIAVNDHGSDTEPLKQHSLEPLQSLPLKIIQDVFGSLQILNKAGAVYDEYREILNGRAIHDADIFRYLEKAYDDQYAEALVARIIKDSVFYLDAAELLKNWKSVKNKELMANCVLSRAQRENFPQKPKLIETLSKVGYKNEDFKNLLINRLFEMSRNETVDYQKQTCALVLKLKEEAYLSNEELERLSGLIVDDIFSRNIVNAPSIEGTFNLVSRLPMSPDTYKKFATHLLRQMAPNYLNHNQGIGLILDWAKETAMTYAHNKDDYETLYNALLNQGPDVRKYVADKIIELGLVDKKSKDFYQRLEHLTGRA